LTRVESVDAMEELKDVVLNVYTLATDSPELGRTVTFFSRMLPSLGMGAYHTSIELDGFHYTFAAGAGIIKTSARHNNQSVPLNAAFREAIALGSCRISSSKSGGGVAAIIKILGEKFFTPTSYHLVHRNCNHFTETFATALILADDLMAPSAATNASSPRRQRLATYPDWINRLASTGALVISHDDDIVPCDVWKEACLALGVDLTPKNVVSDSATTATATANRTTKKTLTEAQKKALAKIRKK
jgi:PPPDE putative peptidase domain